ncbi:MAG: YidC/Oxa1 family membrane protein insertase [Erysipelothrix sp.]|nr:YidC/Oxa1 family membrane protein insertase [Erysipelothrix sp.]
MYKFIKKHKKVVILLGLLVFLVGCKSVIDPKTREVLEQYVIRLSDKFPFGKEGYGWFATFIVWPVAQMFNFAAKYTGAFWSLIIVTILIDLAKMPSTIKSTIQQQKMTALQPEVNRIKEKFRGRDDKQAKMLEATEIQKLYDKHEINMLGSLIPTFLQLPIILAVFQAVQRADLIINGEFLGQSLKGTPKEGFATGNVVYIGIFIGMTIAQIASTYLPIYLEKQKNKNRPKVAQEGPNSQGMMLFSVGMVVLLAFTWNIGMSVYWGISALTRLAQTLYVKYAHTDKKKK